MNNNDSNCWQPCLERIMKQLPWDYGEMEGASRHHDLRGKSCLYKEFYSLKLENNNTNFAQQLIDLMLGQCGAM